MPEKRNPLEGVSRCLFRCSQHVDVSDVSDVFGDIFLGKDQSPKTRSKDPPRSFPVVLFAWFPTVTVPCVFSESRDRRRAMTGAEAMKQPLTTA